MHLMSLFLAGCAELPGGGPRIGDDRPAVPEVVRASESGTLYMLDDDVGAVVQYDPTSGWSRSTPLGATPGRLARVDDTVWVTLPAVRGIAVLEDGPDGLTRTDTLATGAEPLGIAANADGTRLYVALATSGKVQELATDGAVLRTWDVEGQPSWIALRPEGDALYVGSAIGGALTWIDLAGGAARTVELPLAYRGDADMPVDGDIAVPFPLTHRITGDPSVSADGGLLAVPMLLVDNTSRISAPNEPRDTAIDTTDDGGGGYGSVDGNDISRVNPVVALVWLDAGGTPDGANAALVLVTGFDQTGNRLRSYLSSAHISPDGETVLATMEASNALLALSTTPNVKRGALWVNDTVLVPTPAGPRATAFLGDDRVYVDSFLGRAVTSASLTEIGYAMAARQPFLDGAQIELELEPSPLSVSVTAGRALFYSAVDSRMAGTGTGISCSTCHLGGRNDGLSWILEDGPRQTPSLAGGISDTAPFTWTSDVATVAQEASLTSEGRMGGRGLNFEAFSIASFIESVRAPDVPGLGATDAAITRGEAIFRRADVGCAGCHSGELFTDNQARPLFGTDGVDTPSLRRIATTAPYLHDGRAPTLRALLELSVGGAMGDTSMLSAAELDDLEAYLRSI